MPVRWVRAYRIQRRSLASAQQLLGYDQAEQLGIGEGRLAPASVRSRAAERGPATVFEFYVECRQEGVEFVAHNLGLGTLPPSYTMDRHAPRPIGLTHLGDNFGATGPRGLAW